ncbi:MAG: adenylosuccinate synthase [Anaeroplasmataceae bacterium]
MSNNLVIVGTQWGDEGKGKVTDFLASKAEVVVRYQGGNNAGHTIIFDGNKYALQSIPSGIFNPNIKNVMANGMAINPVAVLDEIKLLKTKGITNFKLFISNRANVVMPYHILIDKALELLKGDNKIGTTAKGIGPCYADKASRIGIRMGDLLNKESLKERLVQTLAVKNLELKSLNIEEQDLEDLLNQYYNLGLELKEFICDTSVLLNDELDKKSKILFEGAQGVMLCIDHGTYPYVTSSSPTAAAIPLNCGIAPRHIQNVLGICKAYSTRVGEGPFPTEFDDELSHYIRERGNEYGTVTKRPRRIGYLDAVILRHTNRVSGVNYISLMLLDVLSGVKKLKICVEYEIDGKKINYIPSLLDDFKKCKPVYIELDGWDEDITNVTSFEELPLNAQKYLRKIEEVTNTQVSMFSVGPDRLQTIVLKDIF